MQQGSGGSGEEAKELGLVRAVTEKTTFSDAAAIVIRGVDDRSCDVTPVGSSEGLKYRQFPGFRKWLRFYNFTM